MLAQVNLIIALALQYTHYCCRYGVGYHLTLVKKESCDQDAITNLVKHYVPTAEIISSVGAEIQFVLSSESSQNFEALFYEMESKLKSDECFVIS